MDGAETKALPESPDYLAPDGLEVRLLVEGTRGGTAHFTLPAGTISRAVRHRTVEELWYVVSGSGQMWRQPSTEPDGLVDLRPGVSLSIAVGTAFQFRAGEGEPLTAIATTARFVLEDQPGARVPSDETPPTRSAVRRRPSTADRTSAPRSPPDPSGPPALGAPAPPRPRRRARWGDPAARGTDRRTSRPGTAPGGARPGTRTRCPTATGDPTPTRHPSPHAQGGKCPARPQSSRPSGPPRTAFFSRLLGRAGRRRPTPAATG